MQLAKNDGVDGDLTLVVAKPLDHLQIRSWPRRLAENIGIDEISHSVSVDSDSIATKKPFSGHARSQSTTPSFGGAAEPRESILAAPEPLDLELLAGLDAILLTDFRRQHDLALR